MLSGMSVEVRTHHCCQPLLSRVHADRCWIDADVLQAEDSYSVFCLTSMQHYLLYLPFSLWTGWQVQYMTFPPKQLNWAGRWYRMFMASMHYPVIKLTAAVAVPWFRNWVTTQN